MNRLKQLLDDPAITIGPARREYALNRIRDAIRRGHSTVTLDNPLRPDHGHQPVLFSDNEPDPQNTGADSTGTP